MRRPVLFDAGAGGDAKTGYSPQTGGGGQTFYIGTLPQNGAGTQKAHAGDDLRRQPGVVRGAAVGAGHLPGAGGVERVGIRSDAAAAELESGCFTAAGILLFYLVASVLPLLRLLRQPPARLAAKIDF